MLVQHVIWLTEIEDKLFYKNMNDDKVSSISKSQSVEEMADFWDTHSLADFADQTYAVEMTFDPTARRTYIGIEPELLDELRQIARQRRISLETLVNVWLRQRVDQIQTQPVSSG